MEFTMETETDKVYPFTLWVMAHNAAKFDSYLLLPDILKTFGINNIQILGTLTAPK